MQLISVEESDHQTTKEQAKFAYLVDYYSKDSPLTPLNTFEVNFSSAASLAGVILTYIIVLLQFKISDTSTAPSAECDCTQALLEQSCQPARNTSV